MLSLSACANPASVFNAAPVSTFNILPAKSTTNPCALLPLEKYSDSQNAVLASEVAVAPPTAMWPDVLIDYAKLRDAVRACLHK